MRTLNTLRPGERGTVVALHGDGAIHQRILEMGILEGSTVEVIRLAPLGDPMEVFVMGYHLLIRKSEAALIEIG